MVMEEVYFCVLDQDEYKKYLCWKDMEEQGKLMILPCKPGDTVWDNDFGRPTAYEVTGFSFGNLNDDCFEYETMPLNQIIIYYSNSNGSITGSFAAREIGKTVFLTEPEAKEALERMKNGN